MKGAPADRRRNVVCPALRPYRNAVVCETPHYETFIIKLIRRKTCRIRHVPRINQFQALVILRELKFVQYPAAGERVERAGTKSRADTLQVDRQFLVRPFQLVK